MSETVYRMARVLGRVVKSAPQGTNQGLYNLLWMIVSGRLLSSRGAVIPGLASLGLSAAAVRRAWAALAYGRWTIEPLIENASALIEEEGRWRPHQYEGFRPVAADRVGFYRPRLRRCPGRPNSSSAGKALPALSLGILVSVGSIEEKRVPHLRALVRPDPQDPRESVLQHRLLARAAVGLAREEVLVTDRGFPQSALKAAGIARYLARAPQNFTARRDRLSEPKGSGRPLEYGAVVRPLARTRKGRTIPGSEPDRTETGQEGALTLRAEFFDGLVGIKEKAGQPEESTFSCVVLFDPRFAQPLVMLSPMNLKGPTLHALSTAGGTPLSGATRRGLYRDRWAVEQVPLVAKSLLGGVRQFVFAEECRQRLPELLLFAAALLAYFAATAPAVAAGFWDRDAKRTSGRLRRVLAGVLFSDLPPIDPQLREKASATAHLLKGILGHRRQKAPGRGSDRLPLAA